MVLVLPLVPLTPIIISRPDGFPYTQEATSPSRDRGSATTKTGTPECRARLLPSGSVSTATAPASTACWQNRAPWYWLPGSAAYRSPGPTRRESCATPVIPPDPMGPWKGSGPAPSFIVTPRSPASPESARGGTLRGRRAADTGRGYR